MTAADYWPSEEGQVGPGIVIGFFTASGTVTEARAQKYGTATSGTVKCQDGGAARGDANCGVALKSASTGELVPVIVYGVVKMEADGTTDIDAGDFVQNEVTTNDIIECDTTYSNYKLFGSIYYVLGQAMQAATEDGDEILVLVGKCI